MANIGWIDFSPAHRERVSAILDLLKPEGVVDELGIGRIRDSFADNLFPGISTIQTCAKYFFIIPYILYEYQLLPASNRRNKSPEDYLEKREHEIMWELADKYNHKIGCGVIGITKYKPQKIMRRPSVIYWNGLNFFGFINHGGLGVDSFLLNRVENSESLISIIPQGDDSPRDDADADYQNWFNLKLPYDKNWTENLTLDLTFEEADILSHRMREAGTGMLLSVLIEDKVLFKVFKSMRSYQDFARAAALNHKLDKSVRDMLILSHDFSELMYGAHIAYNCIVQNNRYQNDPFSDEWTKWLNNLSRNMIDYGGFSPDSVFKNAYNVREHTTKFVYDWWNYISSGAASLKTRDILIEAQEYNTKGAKARIRTGKYDDVKEGGWIGLEKLYYRMPQAKRIISDIYEGLGRA